MQTIDVLAPVVSAGPSAGNSAAPGRPAPAADRLSFAQHLEHRQDVLAPAGRRGERVAPGSGPGARLAPPVGLNGGLDTEAPRTAGRFEAGATLTADAPPGGVQELLAQLHGEQRKAPGDDPLLHPDRPVRLPPGTADEAHAAVAGAQPGLSVPPLPSEQRPTSVAPAGAGQSSVARALSGRTVAASIPSPSATEPARVGVPEPKPPAALALASGSSAADPGAGPRRLPKAGLNRAGTPGSGAHEPAAVNPDDRAVLPSHEQRTARTGPQRGDATRAQLHGSSYETSGDAGAAPVSAGIETGPATAAADAARGPEFGSTSPATSSATSAAATAPQPDAATLALLAGAAPPGAAANPIASPIAPATITESARTASTTTVSGPAVAAALREGRAEAPTALGRRTSSAAGAESSPVDAGAHESSTEPALARGAPPTGHDREPPTAAPAKDPAALGADAARSIPESAGSRPVGERVEGAGPAAPSPPVVTPPALLGGSDPLRASALPLDVALPVPVGSAHFREALNVQVSVLARDGVHHAELHLNPADMGPLSVQITLDGQQAQVHFGSDSAVTRQIVESGLPSLAAALRDAGLTLSGGGVSQHAHGQRQTARQSPTRSEDGPPATEADARSVRTLRLPAGRLDTYA